MNRILARLLHVALGTVCVVVLADGYHAKPQPLARSLTERQVDAVVERAARDSSVTLPAWYAKQAAEYRPIATNVLATAAVPALGLIIEDTRANIPEVAELTDVEIAQLYLAQMVKPADELRKLAPTNSLEYLIGAGIRADLLKAKEAAR